MSVCVMGHTGWFMLGTSPWLLLFRNEDQDPQYPPSLYGHSATRTQFVNLISPKNSGAAALTVGLLYFQMILNVDQTNFMREKEKTSLSTFISDVNDHWRVPNC